MFYIYIIFTEGYKIQVSVRNGKKEKQRQNLPHGHQVPKQRRCQVS